MPLVHLQKRAPCPPPPTDVVGKTVPPVAGAATGTAADAAPADDVGASATPLEDDTSGKTRVPVIASATGTAAAGATAVGADCCGPYNRENIGISTFSD